MIYYVLEGALVALIIILLQWREFKNGSRSTRWAAVFFLVAGLLIYTYCSSANHVSRPMAWYEKWMEPWSPVR